MRKSPTSGNRFPRAERLKNPRAVRTVFKKGACVSSYGAKLFFMPNNELRNRIAFAFYRSRGAGRSGAVERNRARRLGREAYRHLRTRIKRGWNLVLLLYYGGGKAEDANFDKVFSCLRTLLNRARLWNNE